MCFNYSNILAYGYQDQLNLFIDNNFIAMVTNPFTAEKIRKEIDKSEVLSLDLAYELFTATQTMPNEGIEDVIARMAKIINHNIPKIKL